MIARNNAASTITSTFNIPVRYDQELRTAPQAPNCIGGSGGRMLYAPQWGVWGAKPPNGGFGGRSPPALFFWTFGPEKPKIWVEMGIFLSKNHEISGARNHVLDPHRCSKVSNSGFNGLKSSKLALYRREKKFARVPFYKPK